MTASPPYGEPQQPPLVLGVTAGAPLPDPTTVARLAPPPRPVPLAYRVATCDLSWAELFVLFLLGVAPIALWILVPGSLTVGLVAAALGVVAFRARRYRRRVRVLRWGEVATVTGASVVERGTYYSGVTYGNARLRTATGWRAETRWYSGPGTTTDVSYTLASGPGEPGTLRLRGLPYAGGVVLADARDPAHALCVSQLPYDVTPGPDGQWPGRLTAGQLAGVAVTVAVEAAVLAAAVAAVVLAVG